MKKIKIAIVDDHLLFRKGLIALFNEFEEIDVVVEATDGADLLSKMKTKKVDVVLTDIEMPVMDGIQTTMALRNKYPDIKILALTMHDEDSFISHLIEKGANGFLLKDYDIEVIVDAIYCVIENNFYFNEKVSQAFVRGLVNGNMIHPRFRKTDLTEKERDIIRLICKEMTNKEIADTLNISHRTVDGHRDRVIKKVGARNTVGLVIYAFKNGLV